MTNFIGFLSNASGIFWVIMLLSVVMWWHIARMYLLFWRQFPALSQHYQVAWQPWRTESHRLAIAVREGFISDMKSQLTQDLTLIKTLTAVLPLLGLLGTVDGMIDNFAVLSDSVGVSELFSSGIAQALLTTLAGLVTGVSGLYFCHRLSKRAELLTLTLARQLKVEGV